MLDPSIGQVGSNEEETFGGHPIMTPEYQDLLLDTPAARVLRITLNRPEARNALRTHLLEELATALTAADRDEGVGCVVLTGGSRLFAAGADIREISDPAVAAAITDVRQKHWKSIREFAKPLIAAVNGWCLGGGNELAMVCDIVVAGAEAKFGQPEIKLGLIPGAGGTQRLTAAIGKARAMQLVLTGEPMSAPEALTAGLVSEVVDADLVQARALELAKVIAQGPPVALGWAKRAVRTATEASLVAGLALEREAMLALLSTQDRKEGIGAFLEKRPPEFKGR